MIKRFTDIVQQTCPFGKSDVFAQLSSHQSGQISDFHRVFQYVLTVACPELESSQNLDQIRMQGMHAHFERSLFAVFANAFVHFPAGFLDHFFDPGRMNPSVRHQFLQGGPSDFTANWVKARQDHRFRCIVDNEIDPSQGFECADIPAFPADDPSLHFFVRQRYDGNRRLRHMIGSATLNRQRNNLAGFLIRFFLRLLFNVFNHLRGFMTYFLLHVVQNDRTGIFHRKVGNSLQFLNLTLVNQVDLLLCFFDSFLFADHLLFFTFKRF
ncbi:hypothetical protein D3C74_350840 [compost metagenome]